MSIPVRISVIAFIWLSSVSCSGAEMKAVAVIDTLPGGIERVINPIEAATRWQLVLRKTIGDRPGAELRNPSEVVVNSQGRVYVLDRGPASIRVFEPDGSELPSLAREGSGPGEIRDGGMLMISRDTVVHQDPNQSRTQVWSPDGKFLTGWPSVCCFRIPVAATSNGVFPVPGERYPDTANEEGMMAGEGYVRYHADGSIVDTIPMPPAPFPQLWRGEDERGGFGWAVPLQPQVQGAFSRSGILVWGDQSKDRIIYSRSGRDTLRISVVPNALSIIPDSIRKAEVDEMIRAREAIRAAVEMEDVPTVYPSWSGIVFDDADRMWLLRSGPAGPADHFDVIAPSGVLLARVATSITQMGRVHIAERYLYAIEEDEKLGIDVVHVYEIVR